MGVDIQITIDPAYGAQELTYGTMAVAGALNIIRRKELYLQIPAVGSEITTFTSPLRPGFPIKVVEDFRSIIQELFDEAAKTSPFTDEYQYIEDLVHVHVQQITELADRFVEGR